MNAFLPSFPLSDRTHFSTVLYSPWKSRLSGYFVTSQLDVPFGKTLFSSLLAVLLNIRSEVLILLPLKALPQLKVDDECSH